MSSLTCPVSTCSDRLASSHMSGYVAVAPATTGASDRLATPSGANPTRAPPTLSCSAPPGAPAGPKETRKLLARASHQPGLPAVAASTGSIGSHPPDDDL